MSLRESLPILALENKAIDAADHKQILPPARKREAVDYLAGR